MEKKTIRKDVQEPAVFCRAYVLVDVGVGGGVVLKVQCNTMRNSNRSQFRFPHIFQVAGCLFSWRTSTSRYLFHLFSVSLKLRMEQGWGDRIWAQCFFAQYMMQEAFRQEILWGASWHAGSVGRHEPGLPPSQQTAEQAWRMLKRSLRAKPVRTHLELADWSAPVPDNRNPLATSALQQLCFIPLING